MRILFLSFAVLALLALAFDIVTRNCIAMSVVLVAVLVVLFLRLLRA